MTFDMSWLTSDSCVKEYDKCFVTCYVCSYSIYIYNILYFIYYAKYDGMIHSIHVVFVLLCVQIVSFYVLCSLYTVYANLIMSDHECSYAVKRDVHIIYIHYDKGLSG